MSNLAALKAIVRRHKRTINDKDFYIRGVGAIRFAEKVVEHEGVTDLIMQKGVNVGALLREAPGFVRDLIVESLLDDAELEASPGSTDDPRPTYRTWVSSMPPEEIAGLADGVVDATMPDGWPALQKKVMPLLAKFGLQVETTEAA